MNDNEKRAQWFAKRDKVQAESIAPEMTQGNRAKYYKYPALLDAFLPAMKKYGLDIIHGERWHNHSESWVITMDIIDRETGWVESDSYYIINEANTNQGHGGSQTYGKRYMFANLIGFQFGEEDDDGERGRQAVEKEKYISPSTVHKIFQKIKSIGDAGKDLRKAISTQFGVQDFNCIPVEYEQALLEILERI